MDINDLSNRLIPNPSMSAQTKKVEILLNIHLTYV